ncbi:MAG: amino acid racemase [Lachnospiraceae bacterium]|nr:amino acid racemase [Lachnospiraceae bacterium]
MRDFKGQKLGILGGMGPQATQVLYQWILDRTDAKKDQEHIPTVILSDTIMPDRTSAILSGNTKEVFEKMLDDCKTLESVGCSCIAIPCNTSHYFADDIQKEINIPIIHMPRETVKRIKENKSHKKVAILATDGTLATGIYKKELEKAGLIPYEPTDEIQKTVMSLIYDEIKKGEKGNRQTFSVIDKAIHEAGCDCAILGCTELSVYREYHNLPAYYIDAMEVLAESAIKFFGLTPIEV